MCPDDENHDEFEDAARSIARELSEFVERAVENFDPEQLADAIGVDHERARDWVESAGSWLSRRVERLGDDLAARQHAVPGSQGPHGGPGSERPRPGSGSHESGSEDPLRGAGPHPLDVPTEEQGLALAALESGRWTVEPGSRKLSPAGEGPGPSDALGLVRELRVRDWIDADGAVTLTGRRALTRWLESATHA
jgi:hypothetical protein